MSRPIILLVFWTPNCMNESKLIFINSRKRDVKLFHFDCSFSKLQSSTRLVSVLQNLWTVYYAAEILPADRLSPVCDTLCFFFFSYMKGYFKNVMVNYLKRKTRYRCPVLRSNPPNQLEIYKCLPVLMSSFSLSLFFH